MSFFLELSQSYLFFFFNDTATTEIYTLSLHDALPISRAAIAPKCPSCAAGLRAPPRPLPRARPHPPCNVSRPLLDVVRSGGTVWRRHVGPPVATSHDWQCGVSTCRCRGPLWRGTETRVAARAPVLCAAPGSRRRWLGA